MVTWMFQSLFQLSQCTQQQSHKWSLTQHRDKQSHEIRGTSEWEAASAIVSTEFTLKTIGKYYLSLKQYVFFKVFKQYLFLMLLYCLLLIVQCPLVHVNKISDTKYLDCLYCAFGDLRFHPHPPPCPLQGTSVPVCKLWLLLVPDSCSWNVSDRLL